MPFFLGDKVLLETWLWMARGWVGAGGAYALRLYSHDVAVRMKPLSIPQNSSVLWVAENYCRARALSVFHSNWTMSYQLMYHLPSGSALIEKITIHSMARSTLLYLTICPPSPPTFSPACTGPELQLPGSCSLSSSTSTPGSMRNCPYPQGAHNWGKKTKVFVCLSYENQ